MRAVKTQVKKVKAVNERARASGRSSARVPVKNVKTPIQRVGELIDNLTADIPNSVWRRLPRDLSYNHDHYLYGTPKKK
jgi:hypothetical protein